MMPRNDTHPLGADRPPRLLLPPQITYESVPGRFGLWTATIETPAGRITATGHSLQDTRRALEMRIRERFSSGRAERIEH
jgi:hypothetical protein